MMKDEYLPMDTEMIMNATASFEPKIAFHAGEVVVIECPAPEAFWLGIAGKNIMELDDATRAKIEELEQESADAAIAGAVDAIPRLSSEMTVPIRWLERVASFENGDDLYRAGREERVKRTMLLCLAHVTVADSDVPMGGAPQYVVTMAERHRLIRLIANGGENVMEDSDDGDVVDGARVAALVSRATVNNIAFFLVKWAGFENAAMTWEPMNLLTQCCPDLVAHFDDAPYKLAIQFPNPQGAPVPPSTPMDGGMSSAPGTPGLPPSPTGRSARGRQSGTRGRGRGGKTKADRTMGTPVSVPTSAPVPVITNDNNPTPPPPPVVPAPAVVVPVPVSLPSEPQPPFFGTPATLADTSKGPISLPMALQQQQQS